MQSCSSAQLKAAALAMAALAAAPTSVKIVKPWRNEVFPAAAAAATCYFAASSLDQQTLDASIVVDGEGAVSIYDLRSKRCRWMILLAAAAASLLVPFTGAWMEKTKFTVTAHSCTFKQCWMSAEVKRGSDDLDRLVRHIVTVADLVQANSHSMLADVVQRGHCGKVAGACQWLVML